MDYKEEYQKALERAKKGLPLDEVFPELKESDEERIRKEMMEYFKDKKEKLHYLCFECGDVKYAPFSEAKQIDDFIAYLEKQKEPKDVSASTMAPGCWQGEEKSAEWSEEDEDMLNSCISSIEEAKENRYAYKETDGDTSYDHEINFLKFLPKRFNLQPKQEWSEEDEHQIEVACSFLKDFADKGYENAVCCIDWLKSLRPQPQKYLSDKDKEMFDRCIANAKKHIPIPDKNGHLAKIEERVDEELVDWLKERFFNVQWKPSEEQMEALARATNRCVGVDDAKILVKLLEQLEKL